MGKKVSQQSKQSNFRQVGIPIELADAVSEYVDGVKYISLKIIIINFLYEWLKEREEEKKQRIHDDLIFQQSKPSLTYAEDEFYYSFNEINGSTKLVLLCLECGGDVDYEETSTNSRDWRVYCQDPKCKNSKIRKKEVEENGGMEEI